MRKSPWCDKSTVKKGIWSEEEDAKILAYVSKHGTGNWTNVPKKAGLRRCGKSCRLRWTNYLRPDLRHENFTSQEEELIIRLHATIGSRWSIIAQQLPGRTDNDVKNYWNTKLKKKLTEMGIDPVTHRPFSQILADYGNMGGFQQSGSFSRDFKNLKSVYYQSTQQGFSNINGHLMTSTLSPKVEPVIHDSLFDDNNSSMELLAQLQAIKFVTDSSNCNENEMITPYLIHEASLSSSASSTCSPVAQTSFCWRDFLLEDELKDTQDQENTAECSSKEFVSQTERQNQSLFVAQEKENNMVGAGEINHGLGNCDFQSSFSSHSAFMDVMLEQEDSMFSKFLNFLE